MRLSRLATFFIALMVLAPASMAREPAGNRNFEAGVEAFIEGDLTRARAYFERARAGGLNTPSLLYNMGVVYFRLGQHDSAEAVFLELLDTPDASLARYNLGLVKRASGQDWAARQWFEQAAGPESPEKLRALALRQLDEPIATGFQAFAGEGYLAATLGYDNNIAGTPDDASSNQAGALVDLFAAGKVFIGAGGLSLQSVAFSRQYHPNTDFDNRYLSTGASWLEDTGAGELTSTVTLAASWFDGDTLEREVRLAALYRPDRCVFGNEGLLSDCSVSGSVSTIEGGSGFSAYDGDLLRLGASAQKAVGNLTLTGQYQLELNDRKDLTTLQEFFSLSPVRNLVWAEARSAVSGRLSLAARGDIRHSRYKDNHQLALGSEVVSERRTDNRLRGTLLAEYRLIDQWMVVAEWSLSENRSTIERYSYSRLEVMIGIEAGF